ncbi:hypothetical protein XELAEV_18014804mg [Xenopus laevis]|uniref:DUF4371 domain-containing protein n=1 Tax=Xenopus laevis TaxID=8355 RepID=A0A974DII7_XENLA|nr:hypothetical protein XELAEV_18014804mg [Xenopus laevis]
MFGHPDNRNFMGVLEVIRKFEPFLKKHIEKFGNAGKGKPSYLSSTTCLEFIELPGEHVVGDIINQIKIAKYFSIIVDSTPDVTHTDQLTFIVRDVSLDGCIEERFLKFLPILSHTGELLFHSVLTTLGIDMGIDIRNCRGQCYDNAANMSGAYKGLQACIKEHNPLVEWVPSGLQPHINNRIETLKPLCDTRWSAHTQATKALTVNYANIHESLNNIADDFHQNLPIRDEAKSFSQQYTVEKQWQRKRKKESDEAAETKCIQTGRERFRTDVFLAVIDRLVAENGPEVPVLQWSTMQQSRLNHLALMSIESDVLQKMDFTSLIKEFSVRKA